MNGIDNRQFQYTNIGEKQDKEDAEEVLERLNFFGVPGNREAFERGEIEVYSEDWAMEASVILNKITGQMVFVDWRSL